LWMAAASGLSSSSSPPVPGPARSDESTLPVADAQPAPSGSALALAS
jgi:hypothetical protein